METTTKCRQCGKEFKAEKTWQRLCSKECFQAELRKSNQNEILSKYFLGGK